MPEGFQQGIPQGEILILKRQLQRRFCTLPEWASEKLAQAFYAGCKPTLKADNPLCTNSEIFDGSGKRR